MPVSHELEGDDTVVVHVSGKLRRADIASVLAPVSAQNVSKKKKILCILDAFAGWDSSDDWGDVSDADRTDELLSKLAFVGDARWRDEIYAYTLKGMRPLDIEFFESAEEARAWLAA